MKRVRGDFPGDNYIVVVYRAKRYAPDEKIGKRTLYQKGENFYVRYKGEWCRVYDPANPAGYFFDTTTEAYLDEK